MFLRVARLVLAICATLFCESAATAAPKWMKAETSEITLYSDADPADVVEFAVGLMAFRTTFRTALAPANNLPPVTVILFRRDHELQAYASPAPESDIEITTLNGDIDGCQLEAVAADAPRPEMLRQMFEYESIWGLKKVGLDVPLWVAQGTGEVLAEYELKDGYCVTGRFSNVHYLEWSRRPIDWARFFAVTTTSDEYWGRRWRGSFHGQAWLLMRGILVNDHSPAENFNRLLDLLGQKEGADAASTLLEIPVQQFDRELRRRALGQKAVITVPFDAVAVRREIHLVAAPEAELHVQLANLLLTQGKSDRVENELAKAQALSPTLPLLLEARARQQLKVARSEEAVRLYRQAIAGGSTNAIAFLRSAAARLSSFSEKSDRAGGGGREAQLAMEELRRAIRLNPASVDAYRLMGRALYLAPEVVEHDVDVLEGGVRPTRDGGIVRFYRVLLNERLGRLRESLEDLRWLAASNADAQMRNLAQEKIPGIEFRLKREEIEALASQGRFVSAHAALRRAAAESPTWAPQYAALEKWLRESEAWTAVSAASRARNWAEAESRARSFIRDFPESQAVAAAREIAERAASESSSDRSAQRK